MKSLSIRSLTGLAGTLLAVSSFTTIAQAQGTLFVEDNKVGIGIDVPATSLDVFGVDAQSRNRIRVHNSGTTNVNRTMFELINDNGGAQFFLTSTSLGRSWQFSNTDVGFIASLVGSGGSEFTIRPDGTVLMGPGPATTFNLTPTGNLTISGMLTENSSRSVKHNFSNPDTLDILERVNNLPLYKWTYQFDEPSVRHFGPMAEDFYSRFGLGATNKGISTMDTSGVALAAIQGLSQILEAKDTEIDKLKQANQEIADRLSAIEKVLAGLAR
jgi:Chaperone of endosialidase